MTLGAHLAAEASKRAKAPTGEAPTGSADSKWAKAPTGSGDHPEPLIPARQDALAAVELPADSALPRALTPTSTEDDSETNSLASEGEDSLRVQGSGASEETVATPPEPSRSACHRWREIIEEKLSQGLTAQRIYQDLVEEQGFTGKYYSVRRFVARLQAGRPLPFRRMEAAPGAEAQVDFGQGAPSCSATKR